MNNIDQKNCFSTYTLTILNDCKRCFWIHYHRQIERPSRISYPPLVGMVSKIKNHFDMYRGSLPEELKGKVNGVLLEDLSLINSWRNWAEGSLLYTDENLTVRIAGALDDCLIENGRHYPLSFDVKSSYPENDPRREKYHQVQMDIYAYLLESHNYSTNGVGYLIYYIPEKIEDNGLVKFKIEIVKMSASADNARALFKDAISTLNGHIPKASEHCEFCAYAKNFEAVLVGNGTVGK